jgi:hypothetical protein
VLVVDTGRDSNDMECEVVASSGTDGFVWAPRVLLGSHHRFQCRGYFLGFYPILSSLHQRKRSPSGSFQ